MIEHLAFTVRCEGEYPPAPELRERFKVIAALARRGRSASARERLMRELVDPRILALIESADPRKAPVLAPFKAIDLPLFNQLATAALVRNPPRQGRAKLYPDVALGPDAREYCALIISMAWRRDAGRWPGQHNREAHTICEALWQAAGGPPHGGSAARDGALTAWRARLVAARRYKPPHPAGELVKEIIENTLVSLVLPNPAQRRRLSFEVRRTLYENPAIRPMNIAELKVLDAALTIMLVKRGEAALRKALKSRA